MKFCPHCGQDQSIVVPQDQRIPTEDVPVPRPLFGGQQGDSQQGSGLPRKWRIGLLGCGGLGLLVLALLVVAIVSGPTNETAQSEGEGGQEDSESENKPTPKKNKSGSDNNVEAKVGERATLDDRTLVVNEVEGYAPPNQSRRPQQGNEYIRVYLTLRNTGDQPINYNPFDFKVQDSNGVQKNEETFSEMPYRLESGSLAPEGTVEGNLAFEVPQGDNNLRLIYETNAFDKRTITVGPL
jgi:hypothetical protein